jgi:hypothetical protein
MTRFLSLIIVLVWGCAAQVWGQVQFETVTQDIPVDMSKQTTEKVFQNSEALGEDIYWMLTEGWASKSPKNMLLRFNIKKGKFEFPMDIKMNIDGKEIGFSEAFFVRATRSYW